MKLGLIDGDNVSIQNWYFMTNYNAWIIDSFNEPRTKCHAPAYYTKALCQTSWW